MKQRQIFLDTNIWLRVILQDNQQAPYCGQLMAMISDGLFSPYTSSLVMLEVHFVLQKLYKYHPKEIAKIFEKILQVRGLVLIEKTDLRSGMQLYAKHPKLADCLIASQVPKQVLFVSYDQDFDKLTITRYTPEMLFEN